MQIAFANHRFHLHPSGALYWPEESLLIVSDLHLEKASHQARRGYFLPPYDSRETLERLNAVFVEIGAARLLLLGDCFHDAGGYARLGPAEGVAFDALRAFDPIWIIGNHDGDFVPPGFAAHHEYRRRGITFRHEAAPGAVAEISGHFHPKAELTHKGAKVSRACFIEDDCKLIMPAFGAYTGGLSVRDPAIRAHIGRGRIHVLSPARVFTFALEAQIDNPS